MNKHKQIIIVIDALDEVGLKDEVVSLLESVEKTFLNIQETVVKICVSSRQHEYDIYHHLLPIATGITVNQDDNYDDVSRYVKREIKERIETKRLLGGYKSEGGKLEPDLEDEIIRALCQGAQGMYGESASSCQKDILLPRCDRFLWVAFQVQALCGIKQTKTIKDALKKLPKDMNGVFDNIYKMICDDQESDISKNALRWVMCARRPLNIKEWLNLVQLPKSDNDSQWETASEGLDEMDLLSMCHNFVKVDSQDNVHFFHLSVREYLETNPDFMKSPPNSLAAMGCLSLLNRTMTDDFNDALEAYVAASYAAENWAYHSRAAAGEKGSDDIRDRLLELQTAFLDSCSVAFKAWISYAKQFDTELSDDTDPFFVACYYGLLQICQQMLEDNEDCTDVLNENMLSPLHAAALQGHADVVQLLCKHPGVDVNAMDAHGRAPLSCAVFNGHCDATKILLKAKGRGVDVNTADKERFTPLVRAAWRGDIKIIKVLIMDMNVDINKEGPGGRNALHWAAHQGDYKIITALLKLGKPLNINAEDDGKHTALQLAVFNAYPEVVQMLLKFPGIDANCRDILDWMPLTYSVSEQNLEIIKILLKEAPGLNVNSADYDGWNALIFASAEGFDAIIELLIEAKGIDVNQPDDNDATPLHHAIRKDRPQSIKALLKSKLVDLTLIDNAGQTPLVKAVHTGNTVITLLLLEAEGISVTEADLNWSQLTPLATKNDHLGILHLFRRTSTNPPHSANDPGLTALSVASRDGNIVTVTSLLAEGTININSKDRGGRTALCWAVQKGHAEIVELLLAAPDVDVNAHDNGLREPLVWAAGCWDGQNGQPGMIRILLKHPSINVNCRDYCGLTPVAWSAKNGNLESLNILLANPSVDPDMKGHQYWSPLSWAAKNGQLEAVRVLLKYRTTAGSKPVDLDSRDRDGLTPLAWGARNGFDEIVKELIEAGAQVDAPDNLGAAPLAQAAAMGHREVVKLLVAKGAEVGRKDHRGRTAVDAALEKKMRDVVGLLSFDMGRP